jgi:hypothetical protein
MLLQRSKQLQQCRHSYAHGVLYVSDATMLWVYRLVTNIKKLFRRNALTAVLVSHSGAKDDTHDIVIV